MVKKAILLLLVAACVAGTTRAQQQCYTDVEQNKLKLQYPQIAAFEAQLKADIDRQMGKMNLAQFKTTALGDTTLHIPIVFHVIHDYGVGTDYVTDNQIYAALDDINRMYNRQNPDTIDVIQTYKGNIPGTTKKYIGKANIVFHLPTKDPNGNPTHGITRRRSYLSTSASDQAKYDLWPPQSYLNIWVIHSFNAAHEGAAAYAYGPPTANVLPYIDGVICIYSYLNYDHTLPHEIGHSLSLQHPWGTANGINAQPGCGDDEVDDTPPTKGHGTLPGTGGCTAANLYDTACTYTKLALGKSVMNTQQNAGDTLDGVGIKFYVESKINLDSVTFYPTDSGAAYQIVLKRNNAVVNAFNGVTHNNKIDTTLAKAASTFNSTIAVTDALNGVGIRFKTMDSVFIKDVTIFPAALGNNFQIVLKRNNFLLDSYSGVTDATQQVVPVHFAIPFFDTIGEYSLEFQVNPGTRRDTIINTYSSAQLIPGVIKITSDTAQRKYNYFYNWHIQTFNYAEKININFLIPRDTGYSLEFSNNPGANRDLGSAVVNSVPGVVTITKDTTQGRYNYFYNWRIRSGYFKFYPPSSAAILWGDATKTYIDYPDTVNSQNVMDYTFCSKMFTYLQTLRVRAALHSSVAGRDNLITDENLVTTGVTNTNGSFIPMPDLPPIADFSSNKVFVCPGQSVSFTNQSWNDTIATSQWTFSNGAATASSTSPNNVSNNFSVPGWVEVSLTVTGNHNSGSNTITNPKAVYVADPNAINPVGYTEDFNAPGDLDKYPIFNHYRNPTTWEFVNNAGFLDNTSIRYRNYDDRAFPASLIGTPQGDYDDFYTPKFDMTKITGGVANLTFMSAGAFRSNLLVNIKDTLEIYYGIDCGGTTYTWNLLKKLGGQNIGNNGVHLEDYVPSTVYDWKAQSIPLNSVIKNSSSVYFRFRFKPGTDESLIGSGNNFYLDKINVSPWAVDVSTLQNREGGIVLAPNPTSGSANVMIKGAKSSTATIRVTDVTGKVVYTTQATLNADITSVEIPANYLSVKGIYLVQVVAGNSKYTEKLVVY